MSVRAIIWFEQIPPVIPVVFLTIVSALRLLVIYKNLYILANEPSQTRRISWQLAP